MGRPRTYATIGEVESVHRVRVAEDRLQEMDEERPGEKRNVVSYVAWSAIEFGIAGY